MREDQRDMMLLEKGGHKPSNAGSLQELEKAKRQILL
jgi:hypothetical protein